MEREAKRSTATRLLAVLLLALPAAAAARDFEKRISAESGGALEVDLDAGSIEVEGHDEEEVRVEASSFGPGRGLRFSLSGRGDKIELRGQRRGVMGWLPGTRVRVRIRVPEAFSLDLRTQGGEVDVEGIEGRIGARTSGGAVSARRIVGPVALRTSGGPVRIEEVEGDVEARTSGGEVRVSEVAGRVDAETSGGPVEVHEVSGPVRVRTSGGPISVRFSEDPAGDLETSGGPIEIEFPEGSGLRLDARTSGGRIELEVPIALGAEREASRVVGDVNGGGPLLRARTSGGPIRIRER